MQHDATPLVHAAQRGAQHTAQALLEAGADPLHMARGYNNDKEHVQMTAREWAVHKESHDVVKLIDSHNAKQDL